MIRRALWVCLLALVATAVPSSPVWAAGTQAERIAEAKRLFKAGARAYKAGKLDVAIQAFEQAYELAPRPALRFSAAQALRRKHGLDPDPELLRKALSYFREYLASVPEGGRRLDALKAVSDLQLLLAHLETAPDDPDAAAGGGPFVPRRRGGKGTLSVEPSVEGATASVNGEPPVSVPAFIDLPAGLHRVVISAPGYRSIERQVRIVPRGVRVIDEVLVAKPASLTIEGFAGADVLVDGRPMGRTPTGRALALPGGTHRIVVGHSGYELYVDDLELTRGESRELTVDLSMTSQRIGAWVLWSGAGAAAIAGGVLLGLAAGQQSEARGLDDEKDDGLTVAERDDYNEAIKARDNLLRASGVVFGLSGAAALVGLLLYSLDEPSLYEAAAGGPDPAPNDSADADGQQRRTVMVRLLPRFTVAPTIDGETPTMAAALVVRGRF